VSLRCLIVDDNDEFLDSASRLLAAEGMEIVGRASSGAEALRIVQTLEPDVALIDIQLGGEDGLELTRQLAADARQTRVILISAHNENELKELIVGSPAAGFLPKAALRADAIAELVR
jgi:CheY-like chemotaxis protein